MSLLTTDVAVIGAGPIGIELAAALKRAKIDYLQFDAKQIGYTISWFPPLTRFFSSNERIAIAGVPLMTFDQLKATREEYLAYLRQVVTLYDLRVNTFEPITDIRRDGDGFKLATKKGRTVKCRRLVLATGGTDRPRKLGVPGEDLPHVHQYFQDPHEYFRQNVLIVGGKNSAVETALRCTHAGANVTISYRQDKLPEKSIKYWLRPEINGFIADGRIKAYFNSHVTAISPSGVTLRTDDKSFDVPADFVLPMIGYEQDTTLFKKVGIELAGDCQAPVLNEATMESSIKNLYIAGTSVGGTQDKFHVFIENCHVHVERIIAALTGGRAKEVPTEFEEPES